jgi:hypothetical protein
MIEWDTAYPELAHADRNIALRNRKDQKPVEERMSIVSNRVQDVSHKTNKMYRLESDLEAGAMAMFKCDRSVVDVQAQFGPVHILIEGKSVKRMFDFCVDYDNNSRVLFAVRNERHSKEVEIEVDLFCQQELRNHAHAAYVLTERQISKPVVFRANRILRAREMNNENNNGLVWEAMLKLGGSALMGNVLIQSGIALSHAEEALWSLIDRGLIVHDHPEANQMILKRHSNICITKGAQYVRP